VHPVRCPQAEGVAQRFLTRKHPRVRGRRTQICDCQRLGCVIEVAGIQTNRAVLSQVSRNGKGTIVYSKRTGTRLDGTGAGRRAAGGGQREIGRIIGKSQGGWQVSQGSIEHPTTWRGRKGEALIVHVFNRGGSDVPTTPRAARNTDRRSRREIPIRDGERLAVAIEVAGIQRDDLTHLRPSPNGIATVSDCQDTGVKPVGAGCCPTGRGQGEVGRIVSKTQSGRDVNQVDMEHRTVGKGEATIVDITGRGLIDSAAQVTSSQNEHPDHSQQRAQTEGARDLWDKPSTVRHSPGYA